MKKANTYYKGLFLAGIFLFSFIFAFQGLASAKTSYDTVESINKEYKEDTTKGVSSAIVQRPKVEYTSGRDKNPFKSYLPEKERKIKGPKKSNKSLTPPKLEVQGIIWGTSLPQAIINSKVVKVGDELEGAKISSISKDGVIIIFEETEFKLSSPGSGQGSVAKPMEQNGGDENE